MCCIADKNFVFIFWYKIYHYLIENGIKCSTFSMEQSPSWEANSFSARQEILRILSPEQYWVRITDR